MKPLHVFLGFAVTATLCAGTGSADPADGHQTYADGIRAVCAGETPDAIDAIAVDDYLLDESQPKAMRLLVLRDAVEQARLADCPRLKAMAAFEPVRPPAPVVLRPAVPRRAVERGKPVRVRLGDPAVDGACRPVDVSRVMFARRRAWQYCYEKQLPRKHDLAGEVTLDWVIAGDGTVQHAEIVGTTLGDTAVEHCMRRQTRRWRFPPPSRGTCAVRASVALDRRARAAGAP